jgi:hypothetical protein
MFALLLASVCWLQLHAARLFPELCWSEHRLGDICSAVVVRARDHKIARYLSKPPTSHMHVHHRTSVIFVLLVCVFAAVAQEQPVTKVVDSTVANANIVGSEIHAVAELEQAVLQKAVEQEEGTEHAIVSHEKAPAALEDVDEFKGGFAHVMLIVLCTVCRSSNTLSSVR